MHDPTESWKIRITACIRITVEYFVIDKWTNKVRDIGARQLNTNYIMQLPIPWHKTTTSGLLQQMMLHGPELCMFFFGPYL